MKRLPYPYVDNCIDYTILGYHDRSDAIESCYYNHTKQFLEGKVIQIHDKEYMNLILNENIDKSIQKVCNNRFSRVNCEKDHIFTRSFPQRKPTPWTCVLYSFHPSQDPSVSIESQPKINHIDYISFVLGVIGSWLGISVL